MSNTPEFNSPQARFASPQMPPNPGSASPSNYPPQPTPGAGQPVGVDAADSPTQPILSYRQPGFGDGTNPPTQPLPSYHQPTASAGPTGPYATSYGQANAFGPAPSPEKPAKRRTGLASLALVGVLAAGIGGAAGIGADRLLGNNSAASGGTSSTVTATQVVQASANNPDWTATAAAVSDAVVAIKVTGRSGSGSGSGVILDAKGNIVTNNHVVAAAGSTGEISVVLGNRSYQAQIVGTDPSTDLAVIRLVDPPAKLTTITFGDSTALKVGEPVMAIGNPLGLADTVTTGIVSALDRPVTTRESSTSSSDSSDGVVVTAAIQTNAAINPGNSGGALVNAAGQLVGITSSIATLASSPNAQSGNIGIGFAIGSDQVKNVVEQLLTKGVAVGAQLGINASNATEGSQLGAQVVAVSADSAAAAAGLRVGDLITKLDNRPVDSSTSLVALIRSMRVGQEVELTVLREGSSQQLKATLRAAAN